MSDSWAPVVPAAIACVFVALFARSERARRSIERSGAVAQGRVVSGSSKNNPTSWVAFSDTAGRSHKLLVMSALPRGKEVEVRYDRQDPSRAFVTEKRWTHVLWLLGSALMLLLAADWLDWL